MCAVSVITAYGQTIPVWSQANWDEYLKLLDQAHQFDLKTRQPNCDDPTKASWMKEIADRLAHH